MFTAELLMLIYEIAFSANKFTYKKASILH